MESISSFIESQGFNYNEVESLTFLAKGGQSYVMRAQIK